MIFAAITALAATQEVHILAVNDMHANIDQFPNFAALVDGIREKHPGLLLFAAGDNRTGNPINDMHPEPSYPMLTLMNKVGFNLSCLGNHEFDAGTVSLRRVIYRSHFRYVCANMTAPDALRLHVEPFKIFEVDGVRVAVLGLIQRGANGLPDAHPDNFRDITFLSPEQAIAKYSWLRDQCDVFVILAHHAYEDCVALANSYPDPARRPDVFITGHSHTAVDHEAADTKSLHNNILITQAGSHLKFATYIIVELEDGKVTKRMARLLKVPVPNMDVQALVNELNNNEFFKRELSQSPNGFPVHEELGCLFTDALRAETAADIALQNVGGIRAETLPKGPIAVANVYEMDPFGNEAVEFHLTGEEVVRLIEAAWRADRKRAPYVSGITYDMTLAPGGDSVESITVRTDADSPPFDLQRRYKVVMTSYIAAVSDYKKTDMGKELGRLASDLVIEYLQKQESVDYKGVKRANVK